MVVDGGECELVGVVLAALGSFLAVLASHMKINNNVFPVSV